MAGIVGSRGLPVSGTGTDGAPEPDHTVERGQRMTIRAAIVGYGNLGRSVEKLVKLQPDMELVGIFSRRSGLDTDTPVLPAASAAEHAEGIDVLFLCLGSATDIP